MEAMSGRSVRSARSVRSGGSGGSGITAAGGDDGRRHGWRHNLPARLLVLGAVVAVVAFTGIAAKKEIDKRRERERLYQQAMEFLRAAGEDGADVEEIMRQMEANKDDAAQLIALFNAYVVPAADKASAEIADIMDQLEEAVRAYNEAGESWQASLISIAATAVVIGVIVALTYATKTYVEEQALDGLLQSVKLARGVSDTYSGVEGAFRRFEAAYDSIGFDTKWRLYIARMLEADESLTEPMMLEHLKEMLRQHQKTEAGAGTPELEHFRKSLRLTRGNGVARAIGWVAFRMGLYMDPGSGILDAFGGRL